MKMIKSLGGVFKGHQRKVLKNSQGIYKIQVRKTPDHEWRDVTYNDTALAIAGKGNPDTHLFFSISAVAMFVTQHWERESTYFEDETEIEVLDDWTEKL